MNSPRTLIAAIVVAGVLAGALAYFSQKQEIAAGNFSPTGAGTYLLQSSISASQASITISASTPFVEPSSNIPYTMTYLGSNIEYATLNPANGTSITDNSEFISFTGITQNSNGSATLTGVTRGLSRTPGTGGCVASSTLAHAYPSQTKLILANSPCFYSQYAVKQNNETISGTWNFSSTPTITNNPSNATDAVNYQTLLATAIQGAATSSYTSMGISQLATSLQIASGTASTSQGRPLVIPSKFSTTTPGNLCTGGVWNCIPVANIAGKLAQTWLDLTQSFTFSGGLWSSASTTIAASNTGANALTLNGVSYRFPGKNGASSTVLSTDGAGALSWLTPSIKPLSFVTVAPTNTAAATTTQAYAIIPAGALTATNAVLKVSGTIGTSAGANYCYADIAMGDGGTTATTTIAFTSKSTASITPMVVSAQVMTNGSNAATSTGIGVSYATINIVQTVVTAAGTAGSTFYLYATPKYTFANQLYVSIDSYSASAVPCYYQGADAEIITP